jgi:deoxyribodipyrimidine photolyase
MTAAPRRIILWFRNDLRLRDNAIIHTAVQKLQAKEFDEVGWDLASAA